MKNKLYIFIFLIGILSSCQNDIVYKQTRDIDKLTWHKDSIVRLHFTPDNAKQKYDLFFLIRNDNSYPYSNLFLIAKIENQNKYQVDTLEYEMADSKGKWLGSGIWDLKESKLIYKKAYSFSDTIPQTISIQQATRKTGEIKGDSILPGIATLGIIIEKTKNK